RPRRALPAQLRQGGGAVGRRPRRPRRAGADARRRPAGRPGRGAALPGADQGRAGRGQRLEAGALRPVAQGLAEPPVQLDGGGAGLVSFLFGAAVLLYLTATWFVRLAWPEAYLPLHERPLLIYALGALLLGAQLLSMGLLAELLTDFFARERDAYSVAERIEP